MKETKDIYHYTEQQIRELLDKNNITLEAFNKWMTGQTCPIVDGEFCYYQYDVDRFIRYKGDAKNEPLVEWD